MRYRVFDRIPSDWNVCAVEDVCEINPSQIGPDYPYSVIEYIDISSVSPRHLESVQVLPLKSAPSRAKRIVQDGDTIISTVRPNRRSFLYIKGAKPNTVVSTGFAVVRPRDIDSRYAHYVLTSDSFIEHLTANATGSAYPAVSPEIIAKTLIPLPPKDEQKRIGEILGALDDKIELNHRMNRTLEAIARAIFKSWFVDFEPFRNGEFVDSELGPIPKGWEVKPITELADFINGRAFKQHEWTKRGLPIIRIAELNDGITASTNFFSGDIEDKHRAKDGDILFSWSASIGIYLWTGGDAVVNQHIFKVIPKHVPSWFIYYRLQVEIPRFQAIAQDKVTTMGHIQRYHLKETLVAVPPQHILDLVKPLMERIFRLKVSNLIESKLLTAIRDHLLPKLLSGEIRTKAEPDARYTL